MWRELRVDCFDLERTLRSGQFFRYRRVDEHFVLLTHGRTIRVAQSGTTLFFSGADAHFVARFFRLDATHAAMTRTLAHDPIIAPLLEKYRGVRIMRQHPAECILAFVCSSNNNIPRIARSIECIAETFGTRTAGGWSLPRAGAILDEPALRNAGLGYRAPYLAATYALLSREMMAQLASASYADAHALLCTLPGIGPKVADCVCLFGLDHAGAFPVDVHILRAMRAAFPRARIANERAAARYAKRTWGAAAGLAQQLLYLESMGAHATIAVHA